MACYFSILIVASIGGSAEIWWCVTDFAAQDEESVRACESWNCAHGFKPARLFSSWRGKLLLKCVFAFCVNVFSLYCSSRALCISKRGRRCPEWFRSKRFPNSSPCGTLTASNEEPSLSYYCYCLLSRWLKARILPMKTWSTPGACQASLWLLGTEYWECKVSLLDSSSVFFRMVYVCISTADSGMIADAANQSCYCVATFEIVVAI